MNNPEKKSEQQAREMLESALTPGERLQAYTNGSIAIDFLSKTFFLGLTMDRLILVPYKRSKQSGPVLSIWRENIQSIKLPVFGGRLKVNFGVNELQISISKRQWRRRAKELVETHNQLPQPRPPREPEEMKNRIIQQAQTFHDLGFLRAATEEIEKLQHDPLHAADPETQRITKQFAEERLAVRVGAGLLFVNVGISAVLMGLFALCGLLAESYTTIIFFIPAIIDIMIGINLWKGVSQQWKAWAILRAVFGFLFLGFLFLSQGRIIDFVAQASLSTSIVITLTGKSERYRTWLAVGIYSIGYIGIFVVTFIMNLISGVVQGL